MEKAGKYLITDFIASGGMAEIFKGSLEGPHGFVKDVVIKAIHPHLLKDERYIKLFLREARLWAKLNHSSIVQVYEFFEEKGRYFLVMEYIKGTDLLNVIKRAHLKGRPLDIPKTIKIFENVLSALEYAHRFKDDQEGITGIIHRDVSPQNIIISINGDVKLTDFGIAKATHSTGLTTQGTLIGKIDYMSPEQALGKDVDQRTDIFSTGIVLWETLTGNKLFNGKSEVELLESVRRCEIISPSSINPEIDERLEKIVLKALQRNPDKRYQTATEFRDELKSYLLSYPHDVAEEDIAEFMREIFPEYVKNYTRKTELLDNGNREEIKQKNKLPLYISIAAFLLILISAAIYLYPRPYTLVNEIGYDIIQDIVSTDVSPNESEDILLTADIPIKKAEGTREVRLHNIETKLPESSEGITTKTDNEERRPKVIKKGMLSINAIPWADVYIGKKKIGTTPVFNYELRAGSVEIIFKNDELGVIRKKRLIIEPNKETRYTEDLSR